MWNSALPYLVPLALTLVLAGAIRLAGGPERGARTAGVAVMVGFLAAWGFFLRPGWLPTDDFSRIGHIGFGAALVGFVLDVIAPRRFWALGAGIIVILVSVLASIEGGLTLSAPVTVQWAAGVGVLTAVALLTVARLDAARDRGMTTPVLLVVMALGLSFMARVAGEPGLATTGLILASAIAAHSILRGAAGLAVGDSIALGAGTTLLAMAWALAQSRPEVRPALVLVPFVFFAEGTARRVPLPNARVSAALYPLILAGLAALPLALAVVIAYVTARP